MAVTYAFTKVRTSQWGNVRRYVFDVSATGTYTATGDTFNPPIPGTVAGTGTFRYPKVEEVNFSTGLPTNGTVAYPATFVDGSGSTPAKLKLWSGAASGTALAELTAATSVTTTTFRVSIISKL